MTTDSQTNVRQVMEQAIGAESVSEDVSNYAIDGILPKAVASPKSVDELGKVMAAAYQEGLAVAPWGGGTRIELGNKLGRLDVVANLSGLNQLIQHNSADLTVTVEAGMTFSELRSVLAERGQFLAIDPAIPDIATVGGTLAAGVSGPLRWQNGSPRDLVIGMKVVQPDGRQSKSGGQVVKNVSGYDMSRLHIGGLGTLGIIAEVSFKLTPMPRSEATILAAFDSDDKALQASIGIFNSYVMPLAMTTFDSRASSRANIADMNGSHMLAVRLGGRPKSLERMVSDVSSLCQDSGAVSVDRAEENQATAIWRSLADFGWDDITKSAMSAKVSATPTSVSSIAKALAHDDKANPVLVSYPAYGMINAHWYADEGLSSEKAAEVALASRAAAHNLGGSMTIERCPVEAKAQLDVWDEVGEPIATMRRMKEQYDPKNILNPGRFVGGI